MKIGIFFCGFLRDAPCTEQNYTQFLDSDHDVNVYLGSWKHYDINRQTNELNSTEINVEEQFKSVFGNKLKKCFVGDAIKFYNGKIPQKGHPPRKLISDFMKENEINEHLRNHDAYRFFQRKYDQSYTWWRTYSLINEEEWNSFDVILKLRTDMSFIGKPIIPIEENEDGIHLGSHWWQEYGADTTGLSIWQCTDQIAWGKPKWMKKYMEYYLHFPYLLNYTRLPHEEFIGTVEHLFALYLQRYPYFDQSKSWNTWPIENINDHEVKLHKHGNDVDVIHHTSTGISEYDYYRLMTKGLR